MITETVNYLNKIKVYLEKIAPEEYRQPISLMSNGTIGIHTRHFIECYQCLLSEMTTGEICYENRKRDKTIEENPLIAMAALQEIIHKLPTLKQEQILLLKSSLEGGCFIKSTVERELLHNLEHTTHHLAMIKIGLELLKSKVILPVNFGVAHATIQYRQQLMSKE